ncbi:MAG: helix-turn-helix transcriptional regulator [Enterobacterales bacterium]|nr:helix-turn-helix transcriptional regulator [Enterobacterales bacterium]
MQPTIWLKPGVLIIYGASLDADVHKHRAIQVVWPTDDSLCRINSEDFWGPLIINSGVEHQLKMGSGWILLVEPKSDLGEGLSDLLAQNQTLVLDNISHLNDEQPLSTDDPNELLSPLFEALSLDLDFANTTSHISDHRILKLLSKLNNCLPGECLKPTSWKATEVADSLHLSESRFLHLFSEQMGIAWRPFLLWHRMICAINAVVNGSSATDAAHLAGFSDSAHLSRTFRNLFGMSIRESRAMFSK